MKKELVNSALKAKSLLEFERILWKEGYSVDDQEEWPKELRTKYDEFTEGLMDFNCVPDYF
jgi:hypothetical protein